MNKKYLAVLIVVVVAGIVVQNTFAAPGTNTNPNVSTSSDANFSPFANVSPSASQGANVSISPSTTAPTVTEQAKTKLIQFVDKPYNVTYDFAGFATVKLSPSFLLSLDGYRQVCTQIISTNGNTTSFDIEMGYVGKINGLTYRIENQQPVATNAFKSPIHCYDVDAPQLLLTLVGKPSTNDQVELWVYLRS